MALTDNEIIRDLNYLRGIVEEVNDGKEDTNKMECEEMNEKNFEEKNDSQQKNIGMELEENEDKNSDSQMSCEEDNYNETDNNNNISMATSGKNTGNNNKKKVFNTSKNYSLRKIANSNPKQHLKKDIIDDSKFDKIDSTRVLRNRKKNI